MHAFRSINLSTKQTGHDDMSKMKEYELSYKDELMGIYSDMFKDLNGFRPRGILWERADDLSVEDLKAEMNRMSDEIGEQCARERAVKEQAAQHVALAEVHPNGFVWKGDYDYDADTTTHAHIVASAPANSAMADALAKAGV